MALSQFPSTGNRKKIAMSHGVSLHTLDQYKHDASDLHFPISAPT